MFLLPVYEYRGYTVVLRTALEGRNQHSCIFTIYRGVNVALRRDAEVVYRELRDGALLYATKVEAHILASDRANEWIRAYLDE